MMKKFSVAFFSSYNPLTLTCRPRRKPGRAALFLAGACAALTTLFTGACNQGFPEDDFWSMPLLASEFINANAGPGVVTVFPPDNSNFIKVNENMLVNFNTAMDTSTLTAQATAGTCSESLQISGDNFATCIAATAGNTGDQKIFILTPVTRLAENTTYKIKVTAAAKTATGEALSSVYVQPNGFTTFNPLLVTGMVLWLRADHPTGVLNHGLITASPTETINTWTDESGAGNNARNTFPPTQPRLQINYLGDKPALVFDGTDDFLEVTNPLVHGASGASVIMVLKMTGFTFAAGDHIFGNSSAAANDRFSLNFSPTDNAQVILHDSASVTTSSTATITRSSSTDAVILAARTQSGDVLMADMGYAGASNTYNWGGATISANSPKYIGALEFDGAAQAGSFFNIGVAEIMVFNRALSNAEHLALSCHLSYKYKLAYKNCPN